MPDWLKRALRTLFQASTTVGLVAAWDAFSGHPLSVEQRAAALTLGTLVVSVAQNALEDNVLPPSVVRALGKPVPPESPVVATSRGVSL